jgi:hypothetical protein
LIQEELRQREAEDQEEFRQNQTETLEVLQHIVGTERAAKIHQMIIDKGLSQYQAYGGQWACDGTCHREILAALKMLRDCLILTSQQ